MKIKWTKKLKEKFGWEIGKTCWILEEECLKRSCFRPHDCLGDRSGPLHCVTNYNQGCPNELTDKSDCTTGDRR